MTQETEGRAPEGRSEAETVELGEPTRRNREEALRAREEEVRPDLDERDRRISTERRPMGPPLREPTEREELQQRERTEGPTDPS